MNMNMRRNRSGQGLLEYIVILAAVITAVLAFAGGSFRTTLRTQVLDGAGNELEEAIASINLAN